MPSWSLPCYGYGMICHSSLTRQSCHLKETSIVCCCSWRTLWTIGLAVDIHYWNVWSVDEKVVQSLVRYYWVFSTRLYLKKCCMNCIWWKICYNSTDIGFFLGVTFLTCHDKGRLDLRKKNNFIIIFTNDVSESTRWFKLKIIVNLSDYIFVIFNCLPFSYLLFYFIYVSVQCLFIQMYYILLFFILFCFLYIILFGLFYFTSLFYFVIYSVYICLFGIYFSDLLFICLSFLLLFIVVYLFLCVYCYLFQFCLLIWKIFLIIFIFIIDLCLLLIIYFVFILCLYFYLCYLIFVLNQISE